MTICKNFAPVARSDAQVLILGSMPGIESLQQQQYYAHPRNAFWDIIEYLFGIERRQPYKKRLQDLQHHKIALWDVVQQCQRSGSLDANIKPDTIIVSDFCALLRHYPDIRHVFFNGQKAAALFKKHVLPGLPEEFRPLEYTTLPSTSPAHAALTFMDKLAHWEKIQLTVGA
jgi:hypoxanthine-DNA glycosylase